MAASLAVGCGGNAGDKEKTSESATTSGESGGGTFIVPINSNSVKTVTPYAPYGSDDWLMASTPCFDPLLVINKDETRWYLAKSLESISDDGCHYQLKLNDGMTWHDGEPITVDDIIFTIDVLLDPANGADPSNISYNGKPISVEKVDDLTLNITLQEPNSAFETEFGRLQPLPKHVFKGTNVSEQTEAANKGIGSGPFKVKEYKEGESITYERYDLSLIHI